MTQTDQYLVALTNEDWEYLRCTLEAVANAVMIAHPGGSTEERLAINQGWAEGPKRYPQNDFVFELFSAMPDELHEMNARKSANASNVETTISEAVEMCARAAALVQAKVPKEQRIFREVVLFLANKVARASKEGGFMGIGGTLVSDRERAVINRLIAVLPSE